MQAAHLGVSGLSHLLGVLVGVFCLFLGGDGLFDAVVDDLDLSVDLADLVHSAGAENADRVVVADVFHNFNVVWVLVSVWVFQS